jgi:hypothetical protein
MAVIGFDLSNSSFTVLHDPRFVHAIPLHINIIDDAFLKSALNSSSARISITSHQLPLTAAQRVDDNSFHRYYKGDPFCVSLPIAFTMLVSVTTQSVPKVRLCRVPPVSVTAVVRC